MSKILGKLLLQILTVYSGVTNRLIRWILKRNFRSIGRNVSFKYSDTFTYENISIGSDVYIGPGALFMASLAEITIGNKVLFGPNVTIITGDHPLALNGKYIFDNLEKHPEHDLPVIIQDDVWIGTGAIILKGVKVGTGSVIAAGAVVTEDIEPYSIVGGVPARMIKMRGSAKEIDLHRKLITANA